MRAQGNAPIIIKRVKKVSGGGHHGGAWKVAYADFVTAMMAFFMLMWLLNATTEQQRKGISDYFSPTIPVNRISGGGDGAFGGDSVFTKESLAQSGQGGLPSVLPDAASDALDGGEDDQDSVAQRAEALALEHINDVLTGQSGESMVSDLLQRHIITELSDEGLVIQLFDLDGDPLFAKDMDEPTETMRELLRVMAKVFDLVTNGVAIEGHMAAQPIVIARNTNWEMSSERALKVREVLAEEGLAPDRVLRLTGHADRKPAARNPMATRNNRIELILLRTKR